MYIYIYSLILATKIKPIKMNRMSLEKRETN